MLPLAAFSGLPLAQHVAHRNMRALLPGWERGNSGLWRVVGVVAIARLSEAILGGRFIVLVLGAERGRLRALHSMSRSRRDARAPRMRTQHNAAPIGGCGVAICYRVGQGLVYTCLRLLRRSVHRSVSDDNHNGKDDRNRYSDDRENKPRDGHPMSRL